MFSDIILFWFIMKLIKSPGGFIIMIEMGLVIPGTSPLTRTKSSLFSGLDVRLGFCQSIGFRYKNYTLS